MQCDLSWSLWSEIRQLHEYSYIWVIGICIIYKKVLKLACYKNFEGHKLSKESDLDARIQFLCLDLGDSVHQLTWLWTIDVIRSWQNTEAESSILDSKSN